LPLVSREPRSAQGGLLGGGTGGGGTGSVRPKRYRLGHPHRFRAGCKIADGDDRRDNHRQCLERSDHLGCDRHLCNAGEALVVAGLIDRSFGPHFNLDRLTNVLGLVAAAIVATLATGPGGTAAIKS
jgi:hypothetical protein